VKLKAGTGRARQARLAFVQIVQKYTLGRKTNNEMRNEKGKEKGHGRRKREEIKRERKQKKKRNGRTWEKGKVAEEAKASQQQKDHQVGRTRTTERANSSANAGWLTWRTADLRTPYSLINHPSAGVCRLGGLFD
jgi:hypothetical protein